MPTRDNQISRMRNVTIGIIGHASIGRQLAALMICNHRDIPMILHEPEPISLLHIKDIDGVILVVPEKETVDRRMDVSDLISHFDTTDVAQFYVQEEPEKKREPYPFANQRHGKKKGKKHKHYSTRPR
jgi:hypothetical protein